jgi:hypothetical protein
LGEILFESGHVLFSVGGTEFAAVEEEFEKDVDVACDIARESEAFGVHFHKCAFYEIPSLVGGHDGEFFKEVDCFGILFFVARLV